MNPIKATTICMFFGLTACMDAPTETAAPAPTSAADVPVAVSTSPNPRVTPAFGIGGGQWQGGGRTMFRYIAIERDGEIHVCGAFSGTGNSTTRRLTREFIRRSVVTIDGQRTAQSIRFFREASNGNMSNRLVGVETNCQTTGVAAGSAPLTSVAVFTRDGNYRVRN